MKAFALAVCVLLVALALAGCGGDDDDQAAQTTAEEELAAQTWADDVCGRIDAWEQELRDIVAAEGEGSATDRIKQKVDQAATATDDLLSDLQGIGAPDTESGDEAKSEVDALAESTKERVDRIKAEAESAEGTSDALQLAANIVTELDGAQEEARKTFDEVSDLDPAGELRDAIENSESCDQLRGSS